MQILCFSFAFAFFFLPHSSMYCKSLSKVAFLDKSKLHSNRSYIYIGDWDKVLSLVSMQFYKWKDSHIKLQ